MRSRRPIGILVLLVVSGAASSVRAQFGGTAASFLRLGFGARGVGMGNAMTAMTGPGTVVLYNPAAAAFLDTRVVYGSTSVLALDRSDNLIAVSAPLGVFRRTGPDSGRARVSTIGLSVGGVFSGVGNIDARDADGEQVGILSTYDDEFFGSFSIRFRPEFSVGAAARFFTSKLYDKVTAGAIALDLGAVYIVDTSLTLGLAIHNLNGGGYRWDTSPIYLQNGVVTEDPIPSTVTLGAAYRFESFPLLLAAELEQSTVHTTVIRGGAEYAIAEVLTLRAGVDGYDLQHRLADQVHPAFGVSVHEAFGVVTPALHYAAVLEPVAGGLTHVLALGVQF